MAQITTLQPYGVPGGIWTFTAKERAIVPTTALHIFSRSTVYPTYIADSGDNLLIGKDLEVQNRAYIENLNITGLTAGRVLFTGTGGIVDDDGELLWNDTTKRLTATGITVTGNSVFGLNSSVFQPTTDSTTFFQVKQADGTTFLYGDSTNGQVGVGAIPTTQFSVMEKAGITPIGGYAIKLTNTTGAVTVQGQTVKADPTTNDAVILTAADDVECFGVFLDAGVADDAEAWVVVAGIADVAMGDNEAATAGNWVETNSAEAGYADATAGTPAASPQHFNEIGHCIETVSAGGGGTHILARCVLHFN